MSMSSIFLSGMALRKAFLFSTSNAFWVHTRLAPHPHTRGSQQSCLTPLRFHFFRVLAASCLLMPWETFWALNKGSRKGLEMLSGLMLPDPTDGLKPSEERPRCLRGHQRQTWLPGSHPAPPRILPVHAASPVSYWISLNMRLSAETHPEPSPMQQLTPDLP